MIFQSIIDDEFSYELGMNPNIKHIPSKEPKELEKLIATYGVVKLKNGEAQIRVCFRDEIEESKSSSRGSHKPDSPWRNHYESLRQNSLKSLSKQKFYQIIKKTFTVGTIFLHI